ncbi:MAG: beta-N-acetylglucosaminidase domain-containing protein, partial [Phycisphaerae bacterium]
MLAWMACALLTAAAAAETRPLRDIVPDYMEGDLETAVIPTPRKADLKDSAFPARKAVVVVPDGYPPSGGLLTEIPALLDPNNVSVAKASSFAVAAGGQADRLTVVFVGDGRRNGAAADVLKSAGLAAAVRSIEDAGEDAYVLFAAAGKYKGANVVLLAGNSPAGDFRALATLRQMIFEKGAVRYVREGLVVDFPRFRFRGNKRPRAWEWRYKANYGWFFPRPGEKAGDDLSRRYFRMHGAWVRHGSPLTATDEEMDRLIAGYDEPGGAPGRSRRVPGALDYYRAGCREFVLKFDDTGSQMSPATQTRFGKAGFFKALHHYLTGMYKRIKAMDPSNRVFFMPRPYYSNSFELADYAGSLLSHGPLPGDIGLSVCGPEVISRTIPTACLREFRELFGLKGKAQIYDNFGRGGEFFAYRGRDADLWKEVECIFPERGTPVTRITVYDYLWNPEAYDAGRSLRLAVRELSSRRPEVYKPLLEYVGFYNSNRMPPRLLPQAEAADHFRRTNRTLKPKYDALVPILEASPMAREVKLADELWGTRATKGSFEVGEYARLRRRLEFEPYMVRFGWREGRVARARSAPKIDGRLDEAAWQAAPPFPPFVRPAWGMQTPPEQVEGMLLAAEEATQVRMLHTPSHLYVGIALKYKSKPAVPSWAEARWKDLSPGDPAPYAWRVPCVEMFFDVKGRGADYYQVISNIAGFWLSKHFGVYEPG